MKVFDRNKKLFFKFVKETRSDQSNTATRSRDTFPCVNKDDEDHLTLLKYIFQETETITVLADANFPASSICACGPKEIRADGLSIPQLLEAILKLLPLDTYVSCPAAVMDLVDSDKQRGLAVPVWDAYKHLLYQAGSQSHLETVERFAFYERAKKAYAIVATGETALYGNLILKKGVIPAEQLQGQWW
ncbi:fucose mutarotase isoform X3 [Parambassis ranga]|uniref:L-fucose mutarotase n=1 Tax=Parambassis ranga TaxID=210632 RepID=A0A6P7JQP5_9TELE|nr:fucose mutarotase isoform X3 [Parambassis ranga]